MYVFLNDRLVKKENARVPVTDNGFLYGDGVYETLRTYGGKVWEVDEHLARLKASADTIGICLPCSFKALEEKVARLVKKNGFKESRIRITVTRGSRGFDFGSSCEKVGGCCLEGGCDGGGATLLIEAVALKEEPREVYEKGVSVVTVDCERVLPEVKSINLLPMIIGQRAAEDAGAYEALFVSESGFVREGTITNVFMVKDGVLFTPAEGILYGLTRELILKLAREIELGGGRRDGGSRRGGDSLKVRVVDFKREKLYEADEIFISNSPRKIIPVVKVDGRRVGNGKIGAVTKLLMKAFDEYVEKIC